MVHSGIMQLPGLSSYLLLKVNLEISESLDRTDQGFLLGEKRRMASKDTMLHKFKEIQIWESPLMKKDEDVLEAFAWEEVMCRQVGLGHRAVAHLWRHENALVIGLRDRRLKQAEEAMQQFRNKGISSCVRPSEVRRSD